MIRTISLAKRIIFTKFGLVEKTVDEVIEIIRNGDMPLYDDGNKVYNLKDITWGIRKESDPNTQNELKAFFLPVVMFNGIWDGSKIVKYSSVTALDFDHIDSDDHLHRAMAKLASTPFVLAVFKTFKPRRFKALVMHDNTDPNLHQNLYGQLIRLFDGYGIDTSCKDLSRKTYLSWDEDIWVNQNCIPYHFLPSQTINNASVTLRNVSHKSKSPQSIMNILNSSWRKNHPEYWQRGNRANSVYKCACQFCVYGVPQDMTEDYFLNGGWIDDDFTDDEIIKHVCGAYLCNKDQYGSKDFF